MGDIQILAMFRESFTLVIMLFCSLLSITFALERWWSFRSAQAAPDEVLGHVRKGLEAGKPDQAAAWCQKHPSSVAQVLHYGLLHAGRSRKDLEELMTSKLKEERLKLERFLGILGTLGNISPFIGLFGTVVGIIKAFRDLAASGGGGPTVVARGIAEALVATAAGLLVAIPASILYNYFMRRLKVISTDMEVASSRLIVMLGAK
jgi:biopolymer transport protein ExbB